MQDVYQYLYLEMWLLESTSVMERSQLNLRISEQLGKLIDAKRIELSKTLGTIPTRSDVLRFALAQYLEVDLSQTEQDRRKSAER